MSESEAKIFCVVSTERSNYVSMWREGRERASKPTQAERRSREEMSKPEG